MSPQKDATPVDFITHKNPLLWLVIEPVNLGTGTWHVIPMPPRMLLSFCFAPLYCKTMPFLFNAGCFCSDNLTRFQQHKMDYDATVLPDAQQSLSVVVEQVSLLKSGSCQGTAMLHALLLISSCKSMIKCFGLLCSKQ